MDADALTRGRRAFWLTAGAFVWGAVLVAAALLVPVSGPQTLVQQNGSHVLLVVAAPAVIAALVGIALRVRCSRGGLVAGYVAWVLIAVLFAECLLGILSVGLYIVPVALLLARAATIAPLGGAHG